MHIRVMPILSTFRKLRKLRRINFSIAIFHFKMEACIGSHAKIKVCYQAITPMAQGTRELHGVCDLRMLCVRAHSMIERTTT